MDMMYSSIAVSCFVIVVIWGGRLLDRWWVTPKRLEKCLREQGFNGNSYRLLFGDQRESSKLIKEALSKPINISDDIEKRVIPHILKTINNYGKNSFMWVGRIPRVHITQPELVREVLTKYYKFQKNHKALDPITELLLTGIGSLEGEKWALHRKIINPAFHMEKLKQMLPAFHSSCMEIMKKWEKIVSTGGGSCEVDVWPDLEHLAGDVISRTLFGSSYEEGKNILHLMKELADLTIQTIQLVYIPGRRFFPSKINTRMREIDRVVRASLTSIINKRLKAMKTGQASNNDLLGMLLDTNLKEIEEHGNKNVGLSIEEVIGECKLFYFAGQDTTSTLLVWTMFFLCRYPEWQERARDEVKQIFGNNKPDFDGINRLKMITMILHEVLRVYPPVLELTKTTVEETKLGPYTIPAGVQLMVPQGILHHDHEIWGEDAKEFKPERFAEGVSKATNSQVCFFPFSWGPRMCIGQNFALLESKLALALILQRFSFELSPSYVHAPFTVITLQPQHGAHLILHKL
uniref:7-deoxyloganic acid hydroxylase CYP72A728v2 n=1 Tax=Camptotheca acuminata TaxID=16922 RepID=A0AA50LUJ8_CAMAC|nr:7-deoxyloganic acid hydroxylase CYP72A728v2 [Camptotheca acuminata]